MAGRKTSAIRHLKKMQVKRAQKAERQTRYASLAGTSQKKKKSTALLKRLKVFNPDKHKHRMSYCGNAGCQRCGVLRIA